MDYADGLALLGDERLKADVVYLDLGISSMQVDARERGFSYSYDAPLDMRMDPSQDLDAREIVNTWDERRLAQLFRRLRRGPELRANRARDRDAARPRADRDDRRARRRDRGRAAGSREAELRRRQPGQASVPGDPHRGELRARLARPRAAAGVGGAARRRPVRGDLLPLARGPAREALPRRARARLRLPARLPGLRVRPRARGRADHRPRRGADARRGGRQPALASRAACAPPASSERRRAPDGPRGGSSGGARPARAPKRRPRAQASGAPAKRASAAARARHAPRRRPAPARRAPAPRRASGGAAAVALPLPVRVLNAPFTRAARGAPAVSSTRCSPAAAGSRSSASCSSGSSSSTSTCSA